MIARSARSPQSKRTSPDGIDKSNIIMKGSFLCSLGISFIYFLSQLGATFLLAQPCAAAPLQFEKTGRMITARQSHTATLLSNGKVLVAGGRDHSSGIYPYAELYDQATGAWTATRRMKIPRFGHTAILLPDGKVLVVGGWIGESIVTARGELYDPVSESWADTGRLITARGGHTATLLASGKVLVTGGGSQAVNGISSSELYDPTTGIWTATGSLTTGRSTHTATLLSNGKVLVAGGANGFAPGPPFIFLASSELYNPANGTWSSTGDLNHARQVHSATLLPDGRVLVAGGFGGYAQSAELYDPPTGTWKGNGELE